MYFCSLSALKVSGWGLVCQHAVKENKQKGKNSNPKIKKHRNKNTSGLNPFLYRTNVYGPSQTSDPILEYVSVSGGTRRVGVEGL